MQVITNYSVLKRRKKERRERELCVLMAVILQRPLLPRQATYEMF